MKLLLAKMPRLAILLLSLISVSGLLAQTNSGAVRGEVKDTQGANIGSAQVILTNQDTKLSFTAVTNNAGIYVFGAVDPGTYKLSITMAGFKTFEATGNVVTLGGTTTADAVLVVGANSEVIEVHADSVTLNTANATAEQVFTAQQVQDLPNLGRDPFMFAQFDANVVTLGDPRYVRAEDSSGISDVSLALRAIRTAMWSTVFLCQPLRAALLSSFLLTPSAKPRFRRTRLTRRSGAPAAASSTTRSRWAPRRTTASSTARLARRLGRPTCTLFPAPAWVQPQPTRRICILVRWAARLCRRP